jgi:general secretion pathway protein D
VVQIFEKVIEQNDKPRAEIVVDVEILEVDRNRAKSYGLELSDYAIGGIFSPEVSPSATTTATTPPTGTPGTPTGTQTPTNTTTATGRSLTPAGALAASPPAFNLNTISRGVSTADFYLAVPTAIVRFLESDTHTRVLAKPQLRGAEGTKLTLKLGQKIPVISTQFTPLATGGAAVNPLASYQYSDVGINLDITPRVSLEGDILLDLTVDDSAVGADKTVGGVTVPTFIQRTVTTRLRLRDGESNMLAGLLQQTDTDTTRGFPGAIHVPVLRELFSSNSRSSDQVDVIMLLTPHIIRTQGIKEADLRPVYIGSQSSLGVGGPPPLIAQPEGAPGTPPGGAAAPPGGIGTATPPNAIATPTAPGAIATPAPAQGSATPPGSVAAPPGSSPVPGTVLTPPPAPAPAAPTPPSPEAPAPQGGANPPPPGTANQAAANPPPAGPEPPITSPGIGGAQVIITPPGTTFRVGQGPYNVPISITGAQRISTITLTITFDPA